MDRYEFLIFKNLIQEVFQKGGIKKPLDKIKEGDGENLSNLIEESTGLSISGKSLKKYAKSIANNNFEDINPSIPTMDILARYIAHAPRIDKDTRNRRKDYSFWGDYRSNYNKNLDKEDFGKNNLKSRGILIFLLIIIIFAFGNFVCSIIPVSEIVVLRIIDDNQDGYLEWVKTKFEKDFGVKVKYLPHLKNSIRIKATEKFKIFMAEPEIDMIIGGDIEYHEKYSYHLEDLSPLLKEIDMNSFVWDENNNKWIGYYVKILGLVYSEKVFESNFADTSIVELYLDPKMERNWLVIPEPPGAAARELFIALGYQNSNSKIDYKLAKKRYKYLIHKFQLSPKHKKSTISESIMQSDFQITTSWLSDEIAFLRKNKSLKSVSMIIPSEVSKSISAISVKKSHLNEPVKDFIKFLLSEEIQLEHYNKAQRLPVNKILLDSCLSDLLADRIIRKFPKQGILDRNKLQFESDSINKYLDEIDKYIDEFTRLQMIPTAADSIIIKY